MADGLKGPMANRSHAVAEGEVLLFQARDLKKMLEVAFRDCVEGVAVPQAPIHQVGLSTPVWFSGATLYPRRLASLSTSAVPIIPPETAAKVA